MLTFLHSSRSLNKFTPGSTGDRYAFVHGRRAGGMACALLCLALVSLAPQSAVGQSIHTWNNSNGGSWFFNFIGLTNWNGSSSFPDTTSETARFSIDNTYAVNGDFTTVTIANLEVFSGDVTLTGGKITTSTSSFSGAGDVRVNGGNLYSQNDVDIANSLELESGSVHLTADSDWTLPKMEIGTSGTGSLVVNGSAASLTKTGSNPTTLGLYGNIGSIIFSQGAQGAFSGTLALAESSYQNTAGIFGVNSDSDVTLTGELLVGDNGLSGQSGAVHLLDPGSTLVQSGSVGVSVGAASGSIGEIAILDGGLFTTGTGATTVNATGMINVTNATFNLNGDLNLNGGALSFTGGNFNWASGKTMTISGEGSVSHNSTLFLDDNSIININGTGAGTHLSPYNLQVYGGRQVNVTSGKVAPTTMALGHTSTGTIIVDGSSSVFNLMGPGLPIVGSAGGNGTLTYKNSAQGNLSANTLYIGTQFSGTAATRGTVNVESGADIDLNGHLVIDDSATTTGTLNVTGSGSTFEQTGNYNVTVGNMAGAAGNGQIVVTSGGNFNSGAGTTTVNKSGLLHANGGTLYVAGDLVVNGGELRHTSGDLILEAGKSLVANDAAQIQFSSSHSISGGATWNVSGGAKVSLGSFLDVGYSFDGTLLVSGADSMVSSGGTIGTFWGYNGNTANITISNGGAVAVSPNGRLDIVAGSDAGTTTHVTVESGGMLSAGNVAVATLPGDTSGTLLITGNGSSFSQAASKNLTIGAMSSSTALVAAAADGTITAGTVKLNPTGTLRLAGGSFTAMGQFNNNGGTLDLQGGLLDLQGGITGNDFMLTDGKFLSLGGTTDARIIGAPSSVISISANATIGDISVINNFRHAGDLHVGEFDLTFNNFSYTDLGSLTTVQGGAITAAGGLAVGPGDTLVGFGEVNASIAGAIGATLAAANGDLVLGDATSFDGFYSDGRLIIDVNTVTLNDADAAVVGSTTHLGNWTDTHADGALNAPNGLLLEEGKVLQGRGVVNTPSGEFKTQGYVHAEGDAGQGEGIVFNDPVSGRGAFGGPGLVTFNDTYSPGNSPAAVELTGNVALGSSNLLLMELAGIDPDTGYDQLIAHKTLALDGTLEVQLIDGFQPSYGDTFLLLTTDGGLLTGSFEQLLLPTHSGITWNVQQTSTALTIQAVPEPSSWLLLLAGLPVLTFVIRRRNVDGRR